jgi:hypothetical protein
LRERRANRMSKERDNLDDEIEKAPKSLEKIIDYKREYIASFSHVIETLRSGKVDQMKLSESTRLIILTHSASITGVLLDFPEKEDFSSENKTLLSIRLMIKITNNSVKREISEMEEQSNGEKIDVTNYAKMIHLKDVKLTPFANTNNVFNYTYLAVFADQIVGVSIAEVQ